MNASPERTFGAPVVVGVDGSGPSLRAVDWAADEAVLRGVPLRVVYTCPWERYETAALARDIGRPAAPPLAQDVAGAAARRARDRRPGLRVNAEVVFEEPGHALVRAGRGACVLVVGTRGRGTAAGLLPGSVGPAVAARAGCPVVVLRGSHDNQAARPVRGRVVVGVGEHARDSAAVRFAVEEARRRGVPLDAVRAWRRPAHEGAGRTRPAGERVGGGLAAALRDVPADVDVRPRAVEGRVRRVLLDASHAADLLVVGVTRHEDRPGLRPGRVALTALRRSACPVAFVPHSRPDRHRLV
ncbi:universal stress protein [Streptomyces sp. NPDC003401]